MSKPVLTLEAQIRQIVDDALNSAIPEPWEVSAHAAKRIMALIAKEEMRDRVEYSLPEDERFLHVDPGPVYPKIILPVKSE